METLSRQEDAQVVGQILAGDRDAYRLLVERHSRNIFRVAFRVLTNEQDAEEVVQETFLRAYRNLGKFEQRSVFSTWLYRIAMNCALDMKKKAKRTQNTLIIAEEPEPESGEVQVESPAASQDRLLYSDRVKKEILQAMEELSDVERSAFTLRHFEGLSIEEIADVLGIQQNAAKNRIFRAVKKMREALGPIVATLK
jgi:RNA polymerase sigma-70 factor (ECF subfamily)